MNIANYFKTNQVFHNDYIDNLEECIEQNNNLTRDQKDKLIKPLYKFYEFPKKLHNDPNSNNIQRVFIYADNDYQAMNKVINTYNIPMQYIKSCGLWRKKVPVIVKGKNIYQYKKRNRKYSDHDIQMNQSLLLDKKTWY